MENQNTLEPSHCEDYLYEHKSNDFFVSVLPEFVPEHSSAEKSQYVYAYTVKIKNLSKKPAKLLRRTWKIRMHSSKDKIVEGPGVVGKTPVLDPGEEFEYTSFCPLTTPFGSMRGSFLMKDEPNGDSFRVDVPLFFFRPPSTIQ